MLSPAGGKKAAAELKDVPPLATLAGEIKEEVVDASDDSLDEDFKAEAISAETVVLNEEGKKVKLPPKAH